MIEQPAYKTTTAFAEICKLDKSVRIVQGGKGSSKTISILMLFILLAISKRSGLILSVVADTLPNLKSGAIRDFEKILKSWGLFNKFKINKTDHTYTYGGNLIEFFSVEGEGSRLGSRRTHLYINECDYIKFATYIELYSRTSEFTIMDFNPRRKFWVHTDLKDEAHVDFIILNFTHNEYIPKQEKESILWFKKKADEGSKFFENKWRVLGLGMLGITEGVVFENWKKGDKVPKDATYLGGAIDWGYSTDPNGIVKLYRYDGKIYIEEVLYQKGLLNSQIAKKIQQDPQLANGLIIADAAEPKSIAELRSYGLRVKKSDVKDIDFGISVMQEFDIVAIGANLVAELENYAYKMDKQGQNLGVPIDEFNHLIDPARYFFAEMLAKSSRGSISLKVARP